MFSLPSVPKLLAATVILSAAVAAAASSPVDAMAFNCRKHPDAARCQQATITPTATVASPTSLPTATAAPATATPVATATSTPNSGRCSAAVHDAYRVTGPDGASYPTWHPLVDPSGCRFDHEHGDDPRTSNANASLPPFGYLGGLIGDAEPHGGFKVFVANRGTPNNEGRVMQADGRMVFHMGTGGPARFDTRFHSAMLDVVFPDGGPSIHLQGMADTGQVGSICDDRQTHTRIVVTLPGTGCQISNTYEIWTSVLGVHNGSPNGDPVTAILTPAVFDPITLMDPRNHTLRLFTSASFPGEFFGCKRETYYGPIYWRNAGGPTTYQTDAYGVVTPGGPLTQRVSAHSVIGPNLSQDQGQFKQYGPFHCGPGLGLGN